MSPRPRKASPPPRRTRSRTGMVMTSVYRIFVACVLLGWAVSARAEDVSVKVFPPEIHLETSRDAQSFVVQLTRADGVTRDVTAESQVSLGDTKLAKLD